MIIYNGRNKKLIKSTEIANNILYSQEFLEKIRFKRNFDMATCAPGVIADDIEKYKELKNYCFGYSKKWSRALGYFTYKKPNNFYVNTAKLNRSMGSIVATQIHEHIHWLDNLNKTEYYGHGDNRRAGKQNTAPYWIDNLAQSMVDGVDDWNNDESSNIYVKRSLWQRFKRLISKIF